MTDELTKLFGSAARVKLLRLFLFNPRQSFTMTDVATRARITDDEARSELGLFERIGLLSRSTRAKGVSFAIHKKFPYVAALQNLLLNAPARGADIAGRLRGVGVLKLVVLSGIFVGEWDLQLDLFIVGDRMQERKLRDRIKQLEAEIGKELRFALLSSEDFYYRHNMNDKLVRDVLDYPHKIVVDKLNIRLK